MEWVINYGADGAIFSTLLWAAALISHRWLRKRYCTTGLRLRFWLTLVALTCAGVYTAFLSGENERNRLREAVSGIAPTYAQELQLMGHSKITLETPADDPAYLKLVNAEIRWLNANPVVNDIYTYRQDTDGKIRMIVDSETDYNRDGKIDEDREQRTAIGEPYPEVTDAMLVPFTGKASFDGVPETDRWGTWVSALVPMYDENGKVEAVLGVDFDAHTWVLAIARSRAMPLSIMAVLGVILVSTATTLNIKHSEIERRRKTELALRRSEARLQTILDNEPECVKVVDVTDTGCVLEMNPAGRNMLELDAADDVVGTAFSAYVEPADQKDFFKIHKKACAGERASGQFQVVGKRGGRKWLESQAVPLFDDNGKVASVLSVARDITDRKLAEAEREKLQGQLVEASRAAGMAEIAIGVLHNVGNVLNSVNISAGVMSEKLRNSKVGNLTKATEMIQSRQADLGNFLTTDEKGKQLPLYLNKLAHFLGDEQATMLTELSSMTEGLEHIKEIVRRQQSLARTSSPREIANPTVVMEEALKLNTLSIERHAIELIREYADCPAVELDKHQTMQVLVNLISNAKNAVKTTDHAPRTITLRVQMAERDGEARVVFEVQDNGVGIKSEHVIKIFQHGFTTRREGHGFGLHSAANSAKTMSGNLTCRSDGPGTGATFTLDIPAVLVTSEAL